MAVRLLGDGRGFINTTDIPAYSGNLTVCFWLRLDTAEAVTERVIYSLHDDPWSAASWQISTKADVLELYLWNGVTEADTYRDADSALTIGTWYHVAITTSGSTHKLYVNGIQEGEDLTVDLGSMAAEIGELLGSASGQVGLFSVGYFRLWRATLSGAEIQAEMAAATAVRTANLYRDVPLKTVDGSDVSGNGYDFVVVGPLGMEVVDGPVPSSSPSMSPSASASTSPSVSASASPSTSVSPSSSESASGSSSTSPSASASEPPPPGTLLTGGIVQRMTRSTDLPVTYAAGTTSLSLALPDYYPPVHRLIQAGDILVMALAHKGLDWAVVPSGWTLIGREVSAGIRGEMYWKRAAADEAGPYAITGLADTASGCLWAYANCVKTGSPIDASAFRANAAGTTGTDGVTTSQPYALIINAAALADNLACSAWSMASATRPMIELCERQTTNGTDCTLAASHLLLREAGSTGATGWTSSAIANVGMCVALIPDETEAPQTGTTVTGVPTNVSAATAYEIPSSSARIIHDISAGSFPQDLWYHYTPDADETGLGVYVWTNVLAGTVEVSVTLYSGTPSALAEIPLTAWWGASSPGCGPLILPFTGTGTYYIRVQNTASLYGTPDQGDATVVLSCTPAPDEAIVGGDIFVPPPSHEEATPYVGVILDPDDGHVKKLVNTWENCEFADCAPSGVYLAQGAGWTTLSLYDSALAKIRDITGVVVDDDYHSYRQPQIRCDGIHTFYVAQQTAVDPVVLPAVVKTVSDEGVVGAQTWTLPLASSEMLAGMSPSRDGTILYYTNEQDGIVYQWDLVNDVALANFAAQPRANDKCGWDVLVLDDDSVLVCYDRINPTPRSDRIIRYAADGSILNTYDLGVWYVARIGRGQTDDTFIAQLWWHGEDGDSTLSAWKTIREIQVSDGATVREFTVPMNDQTVGLQTQDRTPTWQFGPPAWCPLFVMPAVPSPSSSPSPEPPRLIRRLRQAPHLSDEQMWIFISSFQLDLETGRGLTSGQGIDPQIMCQWSDDGGHTWSEEAWVSAGVQGAYQWRAIWRRLGKSRDRVWRVVVSDPVPWRFLDAYISVEKGTA